MQSFDIPSFIERPTGVFVLDLLPLLSLLPCWWTLHIFHKTRRYGDFLMYGMGFLLACLYHWCQMCPEGLKVKRVAGVSGDDWRSYDILLCLTLLTRTVGHIFAVTPLPYSLIPNVVFPLGLGIVCVATERVEMSMLVSLALGTMVTTAMISVLCRGPKYLPSFHHGTCVFLCFYGAAVCLVLPNFIGVYWLCHSLWHLLLAIGYYQLYYEIEEAQLKTLNGVVKKLD